MKSPITGMSRFEISQMKSLTIKQLEDKQEYYRKLALQWTTIPNGSQQANKYWTAFHRYEKAIEKRNKCYCGKQCVKATVLCAEHLKKNEEQTKKFKNLV